MQERRGMVLSAHYKVQHVIYRNEITWDIPFLLALQVLIDTGNNVPSPGAHVLSSCGRRSTSQSVHPKHLLEVLAFVLRRLCNCLTPTAVLAVR